MTEERPVMVCYPKDDGDVIFAEFRNNLKVDLAVAKEMVASRMDFTNNKDHYVVIDMSNVREVTPDAKEFLQRQDTGLKNILGAAFIATNPVSKLISNIFIKTPKDFPARFFSNKEDAMIWIYEQRRKMNNLPK